MKIVIPPISWKKILVEATSITFSVLLALSVNEWREKEKKKETANKALESIYNEITFNSQILEKRRAYYRAMADTLTMMIEEKGEDAPLENIQGFHGINPVLLRRSSYEISIASQIFSDVPFELSETIAFAYSIQDFYLKGMDKFIDRMLQDRITTLSQLKGLFVEWDTTGEELQRIYSQTLKLLPKPQKAVEMK